eukprot:694451-Rhodomonas_salina.1
MHHVNGSGPGTPGPANGRQGLGDGELGHCELSQQYASLTNPPPHFCTMYASHTLPHTPLFSHCSSTHAIPAMPAACGADLWCMSAAGFSPTTDRTVLSRETDTVSRLELAPDAVTGLLSLQEQVSPNQPEAAAQQGPQTPRGVFAAGLLNILKSGPSQQRQLDSEEEHWNQYSQVKVADGTKIFEGDHPNQ